MTNTKYQEYNKLLGYNLFTEIDPEKVCYNSYLSNGDSLIDVYYDEKYEGNIERTNITTRYGSYSPDPVQLDQFNKADGGKVKPALLIRDMPEAIEHVSAVLTYGAEKYEARGWRNVDPDRYEDALLRHFIEWSQGRDCDKESGLHHLAHLACNSMFLLALELERLNYPKPKWNKPPRNHRK